MSRLPRTLCSWLVLCGSLWTHSAAAQTPERHYFYHGYSYGSQALFGPLSVFVNRGYDVLQVRVRSRNLLDQDYARNGRNVFNNLVEPFTPIKKRGAWTFTSEEILPLTFQGNRTRWVPNYSLHLIGGGMTYRALAEWYRDNGAEWPRLFSGATLLAAAFVNETLENKGVVGPNTDAIADFYFFDIGGIALFSIDWVAHFFSEEVVIADWSLQAAFTYPDFALHNQGNYYAAKWPLPFYPKLRAFSYFGMSSLWGLSYKLDSEYSVSAAGGVRASRLVNDSANSVLNRVEFVPSGGVFVDRNDSLLATVQLSNVQDYFLELELYPNALTGMAPGLGMFSVVDKTGRFIVGLSFSALEFGAGLGSL